jgi:hypothetical protein
MKKILLLIAFVCCNLLLKAQPDWTGPNLQIGYKFGGVKANIVQLTDPANVNSALFQQKVGFNNSCLDVRYGKLSKHFYYDVDLSGVILSFQNIIANKYTQDRKIKNYQLPTPTYISGFVVNDLYGNDMPLLEFRMGFGAKGIYVGPQLTYYENRSQLFESNKSLSYGLHAAYWLSLEKICRFKGTIMYNTYTKGKDIITYNFKGKDLTFDLTAFWGKSGSSVGLYSGIGITRKFGNNELPGDYHTRLNATGYTYLSHAIYQSGTLVSFKVGVFLNNGKNGDFENTTISVSSGSKGSRSIGGSSSSESVKSEPTTCTSCNGKGTYSCNRCSGTGSIRVNSGPDMQKCNVCNGKGYSTCIVCNGKGKLNK